MLQYKRLLNLLFGVLALAAALSFSACNLDDLDDPNNPSSSAIESNATLAEIQNVVDGIQSGMRNNLAIYYDGVGVIGREFYRFSGSDPRYTQDLLGGDDAVLDPGGFYTTNAFGSRYRVIRNCYILDNAVTNTSAVLTSEQRRAAAGFSKTIRAHELLLAFNQQWTNGIRTDVSDPDNLGPFIGENNPKDALREIAAILEEGYADLQAGGASFPFALRSGFDGFQTPADFGKFNRALLARVQAYNENWDVVLQALGASFLDATGLVNGGVFYVYSIAGGDLLNEMYQSPTATGEIRIVQPANITDLEAGDDRQSKFFHRADAPSQSGLSGEYGFAVYASNTDPIPVIRNEELILLFAEANIQKGGAGLTTGKDALNVVRALHNLGPTAAATQAELIDEMLEQRRYSLYGEGHRWVDMRRYGRLSQLPIDRPGDDVWEKFPRPSNE
ncbi:MAG TPA: RagB/SusD family nutrient uptake outer membrane protein [Saprospiraceae bacterium]|nr:RagB/SusD family nutrient uptake outer membrane protein [Saprospiraceae bacterium]